MFFYFLGGCDTVGVGFDAETESRPSGADFRKF